MAVRPGKSGAGGGECLEAEPLQVACAADVPGVGNDEASGLVQSVKRAALVGNAGTDVRHLNSSGEIPIVHATENSRTPRLLIRSLAEPTRLTRNTQTGSQRRSRAPWRDSRYRGGTAPSSSESRSRARTPGLERRQPYRPNPRRRARGRRR